MKVFSKDLGNERESLLCMHHGLVYIPSPVYNCEDITWKHLSTLQWSLPISYDSLEEITFQCFTFELNIPYWACFIRSIDNIDINEMNF